MKPQLEERRPRDRSWQQMVLPPAARMGLQVLAGSGWARGPVSVVSTLVVADYPDGVGAGPQWHVSVSRRGKRPKPHDVRSFLRAFGLEGAEEDNHHPGGARHFWLPVDPQHRVDCECKVNEMVVVEADGYRWSNPRPESGELCRGCEWWGLAGKPCPLHGSERG